MEKTRRALTTNATLVSNYVNKRLKALTASLATVKPQVLPEVESSVALARRALEEIIRQTKDELSAAVKGRLRATEANIQAEKEAEEAKERLLGASIHQMSQGDQHFEAEWQDSLNTIDDTLQRLRAASHRNNSEIDATFAAEEAEFQKKGHKQRHGVEITTASRSYQNSTCFAVGYSRAAQQYEVADGRY